MAGIALLLGSVIGFTSALAAFFLMGVSLLAALALWSLIGTGATAVLVGFIAMPRPESRATSLAENT